MVLLEEQRPTPLALSLDMKCKVCKRSLDVVRGGFLEAGKTRDDKCLRCHRRVASQCARKQTVECPRRALGDTKSTIESHPQFAPGTETVEYRGGWWTKRGAPVGPGGRKPVGIGVGVGIGIGIGILAHKFSRSQGG